MGKCVVSKTWGQLVDLGTPQTSGRWPEPDASRCLLAGRELQLGPAEMSILVKSSELEKGI